MASGIYTYILVCIHICIYTLWFLTQGIATEGRFLPLRFADGNMQNYIIMLIIKIIIKDGLVSFQSTVLCPGSTSCTCIQVLFFIFCLGI